MNLGAFAGGMAGGLSTGLQLRSLRDKDTRLQKKAEREDEEHEWKRTDRETAKSERDALNRAWQRFGTEVMPLSFRQDGSNAPVEAVAPMDSLALKPLGERPGFGPAGGLGALGGLGANATRGFQGFAQGGLVGLSDEQMAQNRQQALAAMQMQAPEAQQAAPPQEISKEAVMQQLWDGDALQNPDKLTAMARILHEEGVGEKMVPWLERAFTAKKTNKVAGAMKLLQGDVDGAIDALAQGGVKLADRPTKVKPDDPNDTRWKINIEGTGEQEVDLNHLIATTMDPEKYLDWHSGRKDADREFGLKQNDDKRKEGEFGIKKKEFGLKEKEFGLKSAKNAAEIRELDRRASGVGSRGGLRASADRPEKIDAAMKMRYSTIDDLSSVRGDDGKYHVDPKKRMAYSSLAVDIEEEITSRKGRELTAKEHHRLTDLLRAAPLDKPDQMEQWWAQAERRFLGGEAPDPSTRLGAAAAANSSSPEAVPDRQAAIAPPAPAQAAPVREAPAAPPPSPRTSGLAALKEQQVLRDRMNAVQRALQNPNLNTEQKKVLALQAQQIATEIDAYYKGR